MRSYLGLETTRGWKEKTVLRAAPCLFGLYTVVACLYSQLPKRYAGVRAVEWAGKAGRDVLRRHHGRKALAVGGMGFCNPRLPARPLKNSRGPSAACCCTPLLRLLESEKGRSRAEEAFRKTGKCFAQLDFLIQPHDLPAVNPAFVNIASSSRRCNSNSAKGPSRRSQRRQEPAKDPQGSNEPLRAAADPTQAQRIVRELCRCRPPDSWHIRYLLSGSCAVFWLQAEAQMLTFADIF